MIRLGIVVALSPEARPLVERRIKPGERVDVDGQRWVELCGIGAKRARRAAESLLDAGSTALLSWGMAGGLDPSLLPGHLVLPETIVASDCTQYRVDADWHARVCRCLQGQVVASSGALVESHTVVSDSAEKASLAQTFGAVAVDMESAAIAAAARRANIPFMAIRAVADPVGRPIPAGVVDGLDAYGRVRLHTLAWLILQRPSTLADLLRLYRDNRTACATLTKVVKLTSPNLLAS
ncbi:MAG: purine phosphorylase [Acidiferrobacterales bacterium]